MEFELKPGKKSSWKTAGEEHNIHETSARRMRANLTARGEGGNIACKFSVREQRPSGTEEV
jgi:hypothetical protein